MRAISSKRGPAVFYRLGRLQFNLQPEDDGWVLSTHIPRTGPLTPESFADFEWLAFLDSTAYPRGAPPLTDWTAEAG